MKNNKKYDPRDIVGNMDTSRLKKYSIIFSILGLLCIGTTMAAHWPFKLVPGIAAIYCISYVYRLIKAQDQSGSVKAWSEKKENLYLLIMLAAAFVAFGGNFLIPFILLMICIPAALRSRNLHNNPNIKTTWQDQKETLPSLPKTKPAQPAGKRIPLEYQKALNTLKAHLDEMESREASVADFLDDYFKESTISKSRYLQVIQNAKHVLKTNYEKASKAVNLFGNAVPTPERIEIINNYVRDSQDVMNNLERVIDELIKVQQSDVLRDGEILDGLLNDLAETTTYYQKQQGSH